VWHLFVVRSIRREALRSYLESNGIETLIHYPIAPHRQLAYANLNLPCGTYPLSEQLHEQVLSLPISPQLMDAQVDHVIKHCLQFAKMPSVD